MADELFNAINTPTREVDLSNLHAQADDFENPDDYAPAAEPEEDNPYDSEIPDGEMPGDSVPLESVIDPEEVADSTIDLIDAVQSPIFILLHKKELVKKYFKEKTDFATAAKIYALSDDDIKRQAGDDEEKQKRLLNLKNQYIAMMAEFNEKRNAVPFTDDERERIMPPLTKVVKKSGFDVPPGLALTVVMVQIFSVRLIDVYWN